MIHFKAGIWFDNPNIGVLVTLGPLWHIGLYIVLIAWYFIIFPNFIRFAYIVDWTDDTFHKSTAENVTLLDTPAVKHG